jgi:glucan 1,3-beta-glucosidase
MARLVRFSYLPGSAYPTFFFSQGSQNGYDNSGQRTSNPTWAQNSSDVALTLDVLRFIAKELDGMIDILELLNEPAGFLGDSYVGVLRQFFQNGYNEVRATTGSSLSVMIADSFIGLSVGQN